MSPAFGHYFNSTNKTFLVSSVMSSFNAQTVEQKEKELSKKKYQGIAQLFMIDPTHQIQYSN